MTESETAPVAIAATGEPAVATPAAQPWWRHSVIYQLYVKSFADSNGDGIGDLDGVAARLDYLAALGVDGIWLNPCYPSPNRDGGYDVADYFTIDERYGGLPAFERLLTAAHQRGLRVLMDLVPNHCSSDHQWFVDALSSVPGSRERSRFIFVDGRGEKGGEPPNNWRSTFGGPAWTRIIEADGTPGQWYLHSFDPTQPDFNWKNQDVVDMFDTVLRTWFDRGIDGFRIDVAYAMVKADGLPDLEDPDGENPYLWNQPGVHEILKHWRTLADGYGRELTLLGEVWLPPADAADYIRVGELNQVFYFDLLQQPFGATAFRVSIADTLEGLTQAAGVPTWTLNSHDVHRAVTRYGLVEAEPLHTADINALRTRARGRVDLELGTRRATAALLLMLALPGSAYLYQGEELGLPEVQDLPDDARRDPIWERSGHREHGRDGCRVPLPWADGEQNCGFGSGTPWMPQPGWFAQFAASNQSGDPASVLEFYRAAIAARRAIDPDSSFGWVDTRRDDVLAFRRGDLISVTSFGGGAFDVPLGWGEIVFSNVQLDDRWLSAGTTAWLRS